MFGIKKLLHKWTIKRMANELGGFLDNLKNLTAEEMSFIIMTATVARNTFIQEMNLDFANPNATLAQRASISVRLALLINECKKSNKFIDRTAYMVWAHTLRVASQPELLDLGKELWKELGRGIEYLNNNPDLVKTCTTKHANPAGYETIPKFIL